jgi:hypothetical protein
MQHICQFLVSVNVLKEYLVDRTLNSYLSVETGV